MEDLNWYTDNDKLPILHSLKFLGVVIDEKWQWDDHTKYIKTELADGLYILNKVYKKNIKNIMHILFFAYSFIPWIWLFYGEMLKRVLKNHWKM